MVECSIAVSQRWASLRGERLPLNWDPEVSGGAGAVKWWGRAPWCTFSKFISEAAEFEGGLELELMEIREEKSRPLAIGGLSP